MSNIGFFGILRENNEEEDGPLLDYRRERRFLRDHFNVLELPNKKFKESFRMTKEMFLYILEEISSEVQTEDFERVTKLKVITKLAAVLNFYATGSYQRTIGDVMIQSMDQSCVCRSITSITNILERKICSKWIKFPNNTEKYENKQRFYQKTGIPGVIGCVDGTHINMIAPTENEHLFVDRKGNHSLNVQIICNYDLKILAVNARYPGSTHDAAIWSMSAERRKMEDTYNSGERNTWLLGDSGYPLEKWLITPFKNVQTDDERRFNHIISQGRNPIERCNGGLKGVFRCLLGERTLRYDPKKVIKITNVCCALFNICLHYSRDTIEEILNENPVILSSNVYENDSDSDSEDDIDAVNIRQNLLHTLT